MRSRSAFERPSGGVQRRPRLRRLAHDGRHAHLLAGLEPRVGLHALGCRPAPGRSAAASAGSCSRRRENACGTSGRGAVPASSSLHLDGLDAVGAGHLAALLDAAHGEPLDSARRTRSASGPYSVRRKRAKAPDRTHARLTSLATASGAQLAIAFAASGQHRPRQREAGEDTGNRKADATGQIESAAEKSPRRTRLAKSSEKAEKVV